MIRTRRKTYIKGNKGFSMLEALMAAFFLGIALVGILGSIISNTLLIGVNNQKSIALYDLEQALEQMQTMKPSEIVAVNWQSWAQSNLNMQLPQENIAVSFPNGTGADPLKVNVEISWAYRQIPMDVGVEFLKAD